MPSKAVVRAHVLVAVLALSAGTVYAQKPPNVTAGELALLPEYCPDTQGFQYGDRYYNTSPRAAYWVGLMGEGFWAHHHYCWALIKKRRALLPGVNAVLRRGGLEAALSDLDYVITHTPPSFILLPEVLLQAGEIYLLMEQFGLAFDAFEAARRRKPDYWPACTYWADALARVGKVQEARDHVLLCLKDAPRQAELVGAYRRLGGDAEAYLRSAPPSPPAPPKAASAAE